jgi:hypothetical protein
MKSTLIHLTLFVILCVEKHPAFAWDSSGHEAVVAVALKIDPGLAARLTAILKALPVSTQWQSLEKTGLIPNNPYQTEKSNPDAWVQAVSNQPEKAATFPDWTRDYEGYKRAEYDKWHFYDSDYDDPNNKRFVVDPNALTVLEPFEANLKATSGGDRAWALAWVLHLIGDLHQPLHCTSRQLGNDPHNSDHGGNSIPYAKTELHTFWDHLPDKGVAKDPDTYATVLLKMRDSMSSTDRATFDQKANDLTPLDWIKEGRAQIVNCGYPPSAQDDMNYDQAAHKIADYQILLGGARLAKVLERDLP